jgi:hypothetical protein
MAKGPLNARAPYVPNAKQFAVHALTPGTVYLNRRDLARRMVKTVYAHHNKGFTFAQAQVMLQSLVCVIYALIADKHNRYGIVLGKLGTIHWYHQKGHNVYSRRQRKIVLAKDSDYIRMRFHPWLKSACKMRRLQPSIAGQFLTDEQIKKYKAIRAEIRKKERNKRRVAARKRARDRIPPAVRRAQQAIKAKRRKEQKEAEKLLEKQESIPYDIRVLLQEAGAEATLAKKSKRAAKVNEYDQERLASL